MDKDTILYLIAIIGCVIGVFGYLKGNKKDIQNDAKEFMKVNLKLDQLCETTRTSNNKLDKINETISDIKSKQLEHEFRLRELEKKIEKE